MRRDEHGGDRGSHPGVELDFSINVSPLGVPPAVMDGIVGSLDQLGEYPDPQCRELRAALARLHGVDPAQIACGNGAADVIHRVVCALAPRRVLTPAPTFSEYERSARVSGARVAHHVLEAPLFDLTRSLCDAVTPETDMVFLCQPNNPTGRLISSETLNGIVRFTAARHVTLVVDECFLPFTGAPSLVGRLAPHVIVLRAFTKTHCLAGLRLGYAVCGDAKMAAAIADAGPRWNVSGPAQMAGIAAAGIPEWDQRMREAVRKERETLLAALDGLGLAVVPGQANFLMFSCEAALFGPLLERGILIRSCGNFPGLDGSYYRVAVRRPEENAILIEALREVLDGG